MTTNHKVSVNDSTAFMGTATWPCLFAQSAQQVWALMLYLQMVDAKSSWDTASCAWKSCIFRMGLLFHHKMKKTFLLCLGRAGNVVGMGWDVKPFKVPGSKYKGFAVGTGDMVNDHATWLDPQEIDDFMIVPTDIISPLHLFIAAEKKFLPESGVVFLQTGDGVGVMKHMALTCFFDIPLTDLTTLCAEKDLLPVSPDLHGTLQVVLSDELKDISVYQLSDV